jgi:hypothetical protein
MSDRLAEMLFQDHLEQVLAMPEAKQWSIEKRERLQLHVTVQPKSEPKEFYLARLTWTTYPGARPSSVTFLDTVTLATGVGRSWPRAEGFRPPGDICTNWTAEGFNLHPEWVGTHADWEGGENPMLTQLRLLQHSLDFTYQGRNNE